MKEIAKNIEELKEVLSQMEDNKEKKIYTSVTRVLNGLYEKVEEVMVNQAVILENIKYLDDDVSELQEELFEEVSLEELEELESEYKEVSCDKCGKSLFIEVSALEDVKEISCPCCCENIIK